MHHAKSGACTSQVVLCVLEIARVGNGFSRLLARCFAAGGHRTPKAHQNDAHTTQFICQIKNKIRLHTNGGIIQIETLTQMLYAESTWIKSNKGLQTLVRFFSIFLQCVTMEIFVAIQQNYAGLILKLSLAWSITKVE
jgi:hypothetical protein